MQQWVRGERVCGWSAHLVGEGGGAVDDDVSVAAAPVLLRVLHRDRHGVPYHERYTTIMQRGPASQKPSVNFFLFLFGSPYVRSDHMSPHVRCVLVGKQSRAARHHPFIERRVASRPARHHPFINGRFVARTGRHHPFINGRCVARTGRHHPY